MKKFLTVFTSLALVLAVCFSFAACGKGGKISGKTYTAKDYRLTYVTYETDELGNVKEDENGKPIIKLTETFSLREVAEKACRKANDIADDVALTEEQQKDVDEFVDAYISKIYSTTDYKFGETLTKDLREYKDTIVTKYIFKNGNAQKVELRGYKSVGGLTLNGAEHSMETVQAGEYVIDGNSITFTSKVDDETSVSELIVYTNDAKTEIYEYSLEDFDGALDILETASYKLSRVEVVYSVDAK